MINVYKEIFTKSRFQSQLYVNTVSMIFVKNVESYQIRISELWTPALSPIRDASMFVFICTIYSYSGHKSAAE